MYTFNELQNILPEFWFGLIVILSILGFLRLKNRLRINMILLVIAIVVFPYGYKFLPFLAVFEAYSILSKLFGKRSIA